jgi:hypothetical protein
MVQKHDPAYHAARLLYFRECRARIIATESEEEREARRAAARRRRLKHYEAQRVIKECVQFDMKKTAPERSGSDGPEAIPPNEARC